MKSQIQYARSLLTKTDWLPPLLVRLSVGVVFAQSGWGKLHDLQRVIDYFTSLGIPYANLQAPFVAGLEFTGGLLLIFGLASRLISLPLIGVMTVAIATAKAAEITDITDVLGFSEYLYILLLIWILISGPGVVSLDQIISRKISQFS